MTNPEKIGKYIIERELGRGGMAVVYLARDPHLGRTVAIKMILPEKGTDAYEFLNRFQNEAKIVATLNHPAIVPIYDYDIHESKPYLVMQYMSGGSLADRLAQGPLTITQAAHILERIAPALDKIHQKNYIHRDLKPSNILFDDESRPYLADFGLVKSVAEGSTAMTKDGLAMGTQAYMSPEQAMGEELDGRSDLYTLGVILFEMLTGQRPYQATPSAGVALAVKHVIEPVPNILDIKADLPHDSQKIINQAMAKKKDERFSSGRALAREVALLAREQGNQANVPVIVQQEAVITTVTETRSGWRPFLWLGMASVGLLILVTIYLIWTLWGNNILTVIAAPTTTITITPSITHELPTMTASATRLPTSTSTPVSSKTPVPTLTSSPSSTPIPTVPTPTIAPTLTTDSTRPNTPVPTRTASTFTPIPPTSLPVAPTNPPPPTDTPAPAPTNTSAPPPTNTAAPPPTNTLAPENTPTNTLAPG